eukprot:scaffold20791_cov48-Attheya_sp.AAC.4
MLYVRIMGIVVGLEGDQRQQQQRQIPSSVFYLDDGTGFLAEVHYGTFDQNGKHIGGGRESSHPWQSTASVTEGETVDCIGFLSGDDSSTSCSGSEQHDTCATASDSSLLTKPQSLVIRLHANSVAVVRDPNAEALRCLELSSSLETNDHDHDHETGLFIAKTLKSHKIQYNHGGGLRVDAKYALRLIRCCSSDSGLTEGDLALVLGCHEDQLHQTAVRSMLQHLQANGEVYKTPNGAYFPL